MARANKCHLLHATIWVNVLSAGSAGIESTQSSPQPRECPSGRYRTRRVGSGRICGKEILGWR